MLLSSVQFSCSVVSNSLRLHESQHTRPPSPSPSPRVHSDSHPLSQWCHPAISSSVVAFSSCLQSFPKSVFSNESKEISPGISLEGLMLKLKLQYFGYLMQRVDWLEKTDAGREWGQGKKGMTEDEMARWHHWLSGLEFEWTLGVDDGQGGLACCDSWGRKESDTTEWLNWIEESFQVRVRICPVSDEFSSIACQEILNNVVKKGFFSLLIYIILNAI